MSVLRLGLCTGCYVRYNNKTQTSLDGFLWYYVSFITVITLIIRALVIFSVFPSSEKLANVCSASSVLQSPYNIVIHISVLYYTPTKIVPLSTQKCKYSSTTLSNPNISASDFNADHIWKEKEAIYAELNVHTDIFWRNIYFKLTRIDQNLFS